MIHFHKLSKERSGKNVEVTIIGSFKQRKSVIRGDDPVFNATPVFLPVIPVFVVTRANAGFGLTEWAAEFLPGTIIVGGFAIFVHDQSVLTDWITGRNRFRGFRTAWIEGDKSFPIIDRFHGVVDTFHIVALIRETLQREDLVGCGEDVNGNCGIHDVGLGGQLVERQAGDAVHQHMAFVPPVELIPPLIGKVSQLPTTIVPCLSSRCLL